MKIKIPVVKFDETTKKLLILVNVALVVAIFGAVALFNKNSTVRVSHVRQSLVDETKTTTLSVVTDDKIKLNDDAVKLMRELAEKFSMTMASGKNVNLALPEIQPDGLTFGVKIDSTSGFAYVRGEMKDANKSGTKDTTRWEAVTDYIKNKGYRVAGEAKIDETFDNSKVACRMKLQSEEKFMMVCLNKSYVAAVAEFYKPMIEAMSLEREGLKYLRLDSSKVLVSETVIAPSLTVGYEIVSLKLDNDTTNRHWFIKNDSGKWQYFISTDAKILDCSLYNTVDRTKAFAGYECLNKEKTEQVKVR